MKFYTKAKSSQKCVSELLFRTASRNKEQLASEVIGTTRDFTPLTALLVNYVRSFNDLGGYAYHVERRYRTSRCS